jgi:hypothetical protein
MNGGKLEASWTGSDTASVAMPATASWCAAGRYLEIRATREDTGVAVAVFPGDSTPLAVAGEYPLLGQALAVDSSRPFAVVAVRWADPGAVSGVRSDSGSVVVRRGPDGRLGGEFTARGNLFGSTRRWLGIAGGFEGVTVDTAAEECPILVPPPPPPDSGADSLADTTR